MNIYLQKVSDETVSPSISGLYSINVTRYMDKYALYSLIHKKPLKPLKTRIFSNLCLWVIYYCFLFNSLQPGYCTTSLVSLYIIMMSFLVKKLRHTNSILGCNHFQFNICRKNFIRSHKLNILAKQFRNFNKLSKLKANMVQACFSHEHSRESTVSILYRTQGSLLCSNFNLGSVVMQPSGAFYTRNLHQVVLGTLPNLEYIV